MSNEQKSPYDTILTSDGFDDGPAPLEKLKEVRHEVAEQRRQQQEADLAKEALYLAGEDMTEEGGRIYTRQGENDD